MISLIVISGPKLEKSIFHVYGMWFDVTIRVENSRPTFIVARQTFPSDFLHKNENRPLALTSVLSMSFFMNQLSPFTQTL